MNILQILKQLRDDIKAWVTNNLNALNAKIDEKTIPIDSELSSTSTNPVQNKAIANAINNIPRFSGSYNDLTNKPTIPTKVSELENDEGYVKIARKIASRINDNKKAPTATTKSTAKISKITYKTCVIFYLCI